MLLGTEGRLDTEDPLLKGIINGSIAPNMNKAKQRYNKSIDDGKKGGNQKKFVDMDIVYQLINQGQTYKEIGAYFNVSDRTIQRRITEDRQTNDGRSHNPYKYIYIDKDIDIDKDKYSDSDTRQPSPEREQGIFDEII